MGISNAFLNNLCEFFSLKNFFDDFIMLKVLIFCMNAQTSSINFTSTENELMMQFVVDYSNVQTDQ